MNNDFEKASQQAHGNIVTEFLSFMKKSRKFWLLPLIVIMLLLALLMMAGGTAIAPFIYTLF